MVTIRIEGTEQVLECRGQEKKLCSNCVLRYPCLTTRNEVIISKEEVESHNLRDMTSIANYMFGGGKVKYSITPKVVSNFNGNKTTKAVMRLED